jgi:phosphohistidine swiveling domain-containing protein
MIKDGMIKDNILDKKINLVLGKGIPDLTGHTWFKVVRRDNSPFFDAILRIAPALINPELAFDNRMYHMIVLQQDVYSSQQEFDHLKTVMKENYDKDPLFLQKYEERLVHDCENFVEWAAKLSKSDFAKFGDKELLNVLDGFISRSFKAMSHLWPPLGIEEWLLQSIKDRLSKHIAEGEQADMKGLVITLTASSKESILQVKRKELLELASSMRKKGLKDSFRWESIRPSLQKKILQLHQKYAWVKSHGLWFDFQPEQEFIIELKEILKGDPKKELQDMKAQKTELEKERRGIIKKYKLEKPLIKDCDFASVLPHLRFARVECVIESAYRLISFFMELQKRIKIDNIASLYYFEIPFLLKGNHFDNKEMAKRKEDHSSIVAGNTFYYLEDDELVKKIRIEVEKSISTSEEVKGQVACRGNVKGIVRVLASPRENDRLKKGEILVTSMTTPEFVPAMERAAAFVTDEGGISCHAAIVAREMKKPCIIGTKNATKVLKDDDYVEVDAEAGVVRKLK